MMHARWCFCLCLCVRPFFLQSSHTQNKNSVVHSSIRCSSLLIYKWLPWWWWCLVSHVQPVYVDFEKLKPLFPYSIRNRSCHGSKDHGKWRNCKNKSKLNYRYHLQPNGVYWQHFSKRSGAHVRLFTPSRRSLDSLFTRHPITWTCLPVERSKQVSLAFCAPPIQTQSKCVAVTLCKWSVYREKVNEVDEQLRYVAFAPFSNDWRRTILAMFNISCLTQCGCINRRAASYV